MQEIQVRSLFYGWHAITYKNALEWARWKFYAITGRMTELQKLERINCRLRSVSFSLKDLTCRE